MSVFDVFSEYGINLIKKHDENIKKLSQDIIDEINICLNKHSDLIDWFSNNPQRQKELENAFTNIYNF